MIARFAQALAMVVVLLGVWPESRAATAIEVTRVELKQTQSSPVLLVSADFYLPVSARLRELLDLGVALHFVVDFELHKSRWYWRDRRMASAQQHYRLSYHPITRRFRLTRFGFPREFLSLEQALLGMTRIRGWSVKPDKLLQPGTVYLAGVRMRLDDKQLPGPLQLGIFNTQDWSLEGRWKRFPVTTATLKNEP